MVNREYYLAKLRLLKDKNIIKIITGIRGSGKSTILELFRKELLKFGVKKSNIISINFEERENLHLANWEVLYDEIIKKINKNESYYVFLDEIQMIENFEKMVNSLFVKKNIDIYITGSNALLLSGELSTLLTGRYIAINITPYSFAEYREAFNKETNKDKLFRRYMNASHFPEAVNISQTAPELVNDYIRSIYDTVINKDISQRYKLRVVDNLRRVIDFVFNSIGSPISASNIANALNRNSDKEISHNTVKNYLDYLCQSFVLYKARRYDVKGKELLTTCEKYYLVDLGLRQITSGDKFDSDLDHKLENLVYFELLRRGGEVFVGKNKDKEIDFIVQKNAKEKEYYQIAYTVSNEKTFNKEMAAFKDIKDNYPKYLITMDFDNSSINGIKKINVMDWLVG
ncbi:MAG: ATP-binding protein [Fibromonadaceae bacterium]|jgi:predicted AAA+ superfamily ATPase|nr:ATP-binding protein [Fibromonadaceae bacterium]